MRGIVFIFALIFSANAFSDELQQAYEKEFAYLVAEKRALEQRLQALKQQQKQNLQNLNAEIQDMQSEFLKKQNQTDRLNRQIVEASKDADFVDNDKLLLDTTLKQADASLSKLGLAPDENLSDGDKLAMAFSQANNVLVNDGEIVRKNGQFFTPNGNAVDGTLISVGRIASYGVASEGGGILAPAGSGKFKVWNPKTRSVAQQLSQNLYPQQLDVFLYDSADKAIEKEEEKSFESDVDASGLVGKVIIGLGIIGLLLVLLRIYLLNRSSSNIHKTVGAVNEEMKSGDINSAIEVCKRKSSAVSNVIAATLRSIHKQRDNIEDIISESILHESSLIDRFGSAILVIAAISPLLGLLGTVTGMISTFDIITDYGTGDPKLLSSGISEALLTTKFGLVVAIPLLLVGNLLTSWGHRIKNELEQAALHILNTHKV